MGEKGNLPVDTLTEGAAVVAAAATATGDGASLIERTVTTTTTVVGDTATDLATKIRDKVIESTADETIKTAKEKVLPGDKPTSDDIDGAAQPGTPTA